ncbi:MAG: hydrogenase subunit MbhD domain-containing protein [Campylobacterales bacterium]
MTATLFDFVLASALFLTALRALFASDAHEAVFALLMLGLLTAIVWMRLNAADIALVEAAVGGGLSAAILMEVVQTRQSLAVRFGRLKALSVLLLGAAGTVFFLQPLESLHTPAAFGAAHYAALQHQAGQIGNAVTAVLLNYRGYDTLLEVAVLLLAVMGARVFASVAAAPPTPSGALFTRLLAGPVVLLAAYLLYQGSDGHGGAFQAAALLAAGALLAALSDRPVTLSGPVSRALVVGGFAVFVLAGALMQLNSGYFLAYPQAHEASAVFAIELALSLSIGWGLYRLYRRIAGEWR